MINPFKVKYLKPMLIYVHNKVFYMHTIMIRVSIHIKTHVRCFTPLTEENVIERNKLSAMGYLQVSFPLQ